MQLGYIYTVIILQFCVIVYIYHISVVGIYECAIHYFKYLQNLKHQETLKSTHCLTLAHQGKALASGQLACKKN